MLIMFQFKRCIESEWKFDENFVGAKCVHHRKCLNINEEGKMKRTPNQTAFQRKLSSPISLIGCDLENSSIFSLNLLSGTQ